MTQQRKKDDDEASSVDVLYQRMVLRALKAGLSIAEQAMPDTYLQTDRRVKLLRRAIDAMTLQRRL